jgi:hypothetical protein
MTKIAKPLLLGLLALCLCAAACGRYDRKIDSTPKVVAVGLMAQLDDPSDSERVADARVLATLDEVKPFAAIALVVLVLGLAWRSLGGKPGAFSGGSRSYWSVKGRRDDDWVSPPSY